MNSISINPRSAALAGFLLMLPIGILLMAVVFEIGWIENIFKAILTNDGDRPTTFGFAYMLIGGLALPAALVITLLPMLRKDAKGKRHLYMLNLILALVAIALMIPTWGGLAEEIYRCDILRIPNCD